jgi:DNA-binding transcriptional ArsR family regulator
MNEPMDKGIEAGKAGARETKNAVLEVFQALSHPVRLEICQLLMLRQFSVGELCETLQLRQYVVSQQLALLRKAEIVDTNRKARSIIYSLSNDKVRRILRVSNANLVISSNQADASNSDLKQQAGSFAQIS